MGLPRTQSGFTADDYLAWEADQAQRHEYVRGEVFAMAGGEDRHATVALTLASALKQHLRGTPCRVYMNDVKLQVQAADAFFYPDVFVTCSPVDAANRLVKQAPCLVVEVLSPSTAAYDRGDKFASYRLCPSLQEYAVVDIDRRTVDLFRKSADGLWVLHPATVNDTLELRSVQLSLPVAHAFDDLEGDALPTPATA